MRHCRHVFAPSHFLAVILQKELQRPIGVVPSSFELEPCVEDYSVYSERLAGFPYLVYFSRLQKHKGVDILGRALPQVFRSCPGLHAMFVGNDWRDNEVSSIRESVHQWAGGYADRLHFIDDLRHEQLYPVVRHAAMVVIPSRIDNLPNVCMEAMALGKAVIASTNASFDELFEDGASGFLFENGNVDALASVIARVWNHVDRERIGHAARQKIKELSPEKTIPVFESYIARCRSRSN